MACLLKATRLADCHRKCFAPRRWRCSLPQPPERVSPTAHRPAEHGLLHSYPPYNICVISLANGTGKYDVRENTNSARGVDVGTRFFKDARERCLGTFVDSPQCGGGRDDTIYFCRCATNPDPFFLKAVIISVFERRSAPHDQRRVVASAFRFIDADDVHHVDAICRSLITAPSCSCATSR